MVTQLQNQDPTNPTSSSDLLAQMSQIGQLQSSTTLQTTLQSFGLQTSLSSASSMIGKTVQGLDPNGVPLGGVVTSVQVQAGNVSLSLDSGQSPAAGQCDQHFSRPQRDHHDGRRNYHNASRQPLTCDSPWEAMPGAERLAAIQG